ncbi:hypothetical protein [Methanococcus sp. CF]
MIKYGGSVGENEVILRNIGYLESKNYNYMSEIVPEALKKTLSGIDSINMAEKLLPELDNERVKKDLEKILSAEKKELVEHVVLILNYEYFNNGINVLDADLINQDLVK